MAVYNRQENAVPFQYGISYKAGVQAPADDRIVLDYEDLYISTSTPATATLYHKAYTGMIVTVFESDGTPTVLVLKDAAPYTPGSVVAISATNYKTYWYAPQSTENQSILNELNELNASVVSALGNLNTSVINLNSSVNSAIGNLNTSVNGAVGNLNASVNGAIDSLNTSVNGAFGELNSSVNDAIDTLNTSVNGAIDSLNTSVDNAFNDLNTSLNNAIEGLNDYVDAIDSSVSVALNDLDTSINGYINDRISEIISGDVTVNTKFDGGDADDNFMMINKHGSLEKKTIGQLEEMTISEILKAILFEVVKPKRTQTESLTVSWVSTSNYGGSKLVDVGRSYPTASDFTYNYKSEQWNWVSSEGASGTAVSLSVYSGHTWKQYNTNSSSGTGNESWTDKTCVYGSNNGYFFVTLNLTAGGYAVDSTGSRTDTDGSYYKAPVAKTLTSSSSLSFSASYRLYTNANSCSTTSNYNKKDTNPGAYTGDNTKTKSSFLLPLSGTQNIYLQWPQLTSSQHCYLYVPIGYSISACNGANPTEAGTFNIPFDKSIVESNVTINNSYVDVTFNKYEITSSADVAIITLKVDIAKS